MTHDIRNFYIVAALNKCYKFPITLLTLVVNITDGYGLGNKLCHKSLLKETKVKHYWSFTSKEEASKLPAMQSTLVIVSDYMAYTYVVKGFNRRLSSSFTVKILTCVKQHCIKQNSVGKTLAK